MGVKEVQELFEKETSLIARVDNPEYMDWLEKKLAMCGAGLNSMLDEVRMTKDELNLIRQWYNAIDDLNPKYLHDKDKILYDKILAHFA